MNTTHNTETHMPKITVTGIAAVASDLPLYVLNPQRGWTLADGSARARALRMAPHALWIYGVAAASK